jgi:hypothetical protein
MQKRIKMKKIIWFFLLSWSSISLCHIILSNFFPQIASRGMLIDDEKFGTDIENETNKVKD